MRTHYCSTARLSLILVLIGVTLGSLVLRTVSTVVFEENLGGLQQTATLSGSDR